MRFRQHLFPMPDQRPLPRRESTMQRLQEFEKSGRQVPFARSLRGIVDLKTGL